MIKKLICLGVILIMGFPLSACGDEKFAANCVSVMVKSEFQQKFKNEGFVVEDFEWDNFEDVSYIAWYEKSASGSMVVYLKKHGKKQVLEAIEHFKKLEFVESAVPVYANSLIESIK